MKDSDLIKKDEVIFTPEELTQLENLEILGGKQITEDTKPMSDLIGCFHYYNVC